MRSLRAVRNRQAKEQAKEQTGSSSPSTGAEGGDAGKQEATVSGASTDLRLVAKRRGARKGKRGPKARDIRLAKEWNEWEEIPGTTVHFADETAVHQFTVTQRPQAGPWRGASFTFSFDIPEDYPIKPPMVECDTHPIYHPNINFAGKVCLNILREGWKPVLTISHVVFGIITLFESPNPMDPLPNGGLPDGLEAADLMLKDRSRFEQLVQKTLKGGRVAELNQTFPKLV